MSTNNKRAFENCDGNEPPAKIREASKNFAENLLPDKSGRLYKQCYDQFLEWQTQQQTNSLTEETMLVYFEELSKKLKPSSLWAKYSMLKSTIHTFRYVDIGRYKQLSMFMAQNSKGYVSTKAKVLEPKDVKKFLAEAPDKRYLAVKVALIFGITGGCRREELKNITIHDIEHHDKIIVVKIPRTNSDGSRKFMIEGEFCEIIKKYEALRPRDVPSDRFFLCLRDGKCTQQVIGINTFGAMPKMIAEFLGLEEPDKYTGHSFRRTSATMLADAGTDLYSEWHSPENVRFREIRRVFQTFPNGIIFFNQACGNTVVIMIPKRTRDETWMPNSNSRDCNFHFLGGSRSDIGMNKSSVLLNFQIATGSAANSEGATSSFTLAHENSDTLGSMINVSKQTRPKMATTACQTKDWANDGPRVPDTLFCWTGQNEASTQTNVFIERKRRRNTTKKITKKNVICGPDMVMKAEIFGVASILRDETMRDLAGMSEKDFNSFLQLMVPDKSKEPAYYKKVSKENRLLLFFLKIKLGLEFTALSTLFGIHRSTASQIFVEVLKTLVEQLKTWIIWPSKESNRENTPPSFHKNPTCRCIIDYIEIPIDTPSSIEHRILMYSNRKGGFTAKFLIAMTPDGFICKVSKGYGGRATDSFIINECGFSNLIENGDVVLADKEYCQIQSDSAKRSSSVVIPPLESNPQIAEDEVAESYKTAKIKTPVRRAIQRVKLSGILKHITADLLPHIDGIMHICCVIANIKAL